MAAHPGTTEREVPVSCRDLEDGAFLYNDGAAYLIAFMQRF